MAKYDYDLFVIGAGSGGVRAARLAAMSGARVAVAEEDRVGGTCVIRGCVPKKFMVYASRILAPLQDRQGLRLDRRRADASTGRPSWPSKDKEIARLSGIYVTNLQNAGADLVHGKAALRRRPHRRARRARTRRHRRQDPDRHRRPAAGCPTDLPGVEHAITSNEAFHLPELPKRILIVGGGYIAVEFAGIFNGLGVETTLVYRGPNILRGFDDDVRAHLAEEMEQRGHQGDPGLPAHRDREDRRRASSAASPTATTCETDVVMFATGREPYVEGLGLETAGVKLNDKGAVAVDDYSRTNVENIWAVGDVTDRINLTPVAIREGAAFAETEFYDRPTTLRPRDGGHARSSPSRRSARWA